MKGKWLCALMFCAFGTSALAQPAQMSIQGVLTEDDGAPLAGPVNITLRLYPEAVGSTQFFAETHPDVVLTDGVFNISMGSISNLGGKDFSRNVYLGIQVNADPEITPRTLLTGTAAAMTLVVPAEIKGFEAVNGALTVHNQQTTGTNYGVLAMSEASSGRGVYGYAIHETGANFGLYGRSRSSSGVGVYGYASAATGSTMGVHGNAVSSSGMGGYFEGPTGVKGEGGSYGVRGETAATAGFGVTGLASAATGYNYGVWGRSNSGNGTGVLGEASSSTGYSYGVVGSSASTTGIGVKGTASAVSGSTTGVEGRVSSAAGYGGKFTNTATGGVGMYVASGSGTAGPGNQAKADILLDGSTGTNNQGRVESTGALHLISGLDAGLHIGNIFEFYPDIGTTGVVFRVLHSGDQLALQHNGNMTIGGSLTQNSDRNAKQDMQTVDVNDVLSRILELPISTWRYKDDPGVVHMGPMAQDFYRLFQLGQGDTGISTIDTGGAALAAIQGLHEQIRRRDDRIAELETRLRKLEEVMEAN